MRLLLLILSLLCTFTSIHANSSISPICDVTTAIRPIHPAGAKPATAASSQSLQPSTGSYTPNTPMTVTITGTVNGLVIYARDSTGTHVGRWTAAAGTQLITCTGINAPKFSAPQGTTLSHSNSNAKANLRLTWTPPAMANGPITFQGMFTNGDADATIFLFNDVTIMPPLEPTQPPPVITQPPPVITGPTGPVGPTAAPVVPQSPTGVVASAGNGLITIQFTPPRDNGGSPILGYTVSVISPPNSGIKSEYRTIPPIFFLVTNDIPYVFSIVATNAIGSSQPVTTMAIAASDTISVASAPSNIQVIPGKGQATVSWSLPMLTGGSIISAYTVSAYEGLAGAQNVITVRTGIVYSAIVTGLKPGTSYLFSVAAINQMGVGMMTQTQQAVLIPVIGSIALPLPITGVKAVALDRTVRLTWDQPITTTSPILSYVIRSNTGMTMNVTGQPVTFDGLMNNVPYTFTVAANNVAGIGAFSIPSAAVIPFTPANLGTPGQPRITSVTADIMGAVTVSFQPPTDVGAAPITSYTVTSSMSGTTKSGTSSPIVFATGVLPTGTYTFVVVAINSKGSSPASLPSMPVSVVSSTQVMVPGSPTITNLDVSKDGSTIVVTFDPPLSDGNSPITSYTAYTSDNLASIKGTTSPLTLTNVQYVDGLVVYVSATNAIGTSLVNPASGVRIDLPTTGTVTTPAPGAGAGATGLAGFDTGKGFSCTWVISADRVYIDVTMIGQTKGYVSWGVASGPLMLNNADYYTGYVDDTTGAVVMRDTFSNTKTQPKDDAQQDIISFSGTQVNGVTTLKFRRKLDTGDRQQDFAITNTDLFVHWAIAPQDNLAVYHNAYGIQRANLFTGQSSSVTLGGGINAASLLCYMMLAIFVAYAVLRYVRRCTKRIRHSSHIATLQKQSSSSEVVPTSLEHQKSMSSLNSSAEMMRQQASSLSKYHDRLSGADQESQSTEDRSLQTNPALFPQAWGVSSSVSSSDGGLKHRRMNTTITPAIVQPNSAQWQRWESQWQPLQTEEGWQYFFNQSTQETAWEIPPMPDYFTGEQGARYSMAERPSSKGIDADQIKVETVPARPAMAPSAAAARYALAKKSSSCLARVQAILHYRIPRSQFSATQILVFLGYLVLNIICLMIVDQDTPLATRYGWLATANMLIVAVPATRNSVLVWVLGYAFDTVMVFHRWIGRLLLIIVSAHMFGWYALWRSQGLSIYEMQFSNISYQRGFYGWIALVVVNVLSLDFFRRRHFEFFYHTHFTFFVFYFMAYLHKPSQGTYFLITLIMYGIDRLIRTFWGIVPRKTTIVKAKGGDIVQARFPKHPLAKATKLYKVGQYVFVNFPELSLFQWHPFSISSAPEENTAEIHIRSLGDYTKAMLQRVRETKKNEMWIRVDGPYGNHRMTYHRYPVLILVGGGIGITPIISILKDIYHVGDFDPHKQPKVNAIEGICCVWVIPNQATYEWFADEFEKLVQASQNPMMPPLFLWVYVTRDKNLNANTSFVSGKPDFDHIFECAARDYRGKATCVFSCGPDLMVSSCWDATNARKRAGDTFDFHHETFEW